MQSKSRFSLRNIPAYLLVLFGAANFVFVLGYMTNFYPLFYQGNEETLALYRGLQVLNKYLFNQALVLVIFGAIFVVLKSRVNHVHILNLILQAGLILYLVNVFNTLLPTMNNILRTFLTLDVSFIPNFGDQTWLLQAIVPIQIALVAITALSLGTDILVKLKKKNEVPKPEKVKPCVNKKSGYYPDNHLSYKMVILFLIIHTLFSVVTINNMEVSYRTGIQVMLTIIVSLLSFLVAVKVKVYSYKWTCVCIGIGLFQYLYIFIRPVLYDSGQEAFTLIMLLFAGTALMAAAVTSFAAIRKRARIIG